MKSLVNTTLYFVSKAAYSQSIIQFSRMGFAAPNLERKVKATKEPTAEEKLLSKFRSFEEENNAKFTIAPTKPASRDSLRTGLLAYKIGMTHFHDKWGALVPCTVLQVDQCQVLQIKTKEKDGYYAIQVGCGERALKHVAKAQVGHFMKAGVHPKRHIREFKVTEESLLPVGYQLSPRHFLPGQWVDAQAISIGKGYQGTVKRWNFGTQPNSHGNSISHRRPGSIGQKEFPGKVWKGKKMAGQLGACSARVHSLTVMKLDIPRGLIYLKGGVPGPENGLVQLYDAKRKKDKQFRDLLYPSFIKEEGKKYPAIMYGPASREDPFESAFNDNDIIAGKDDDED